MNVSLTPELDKFVASKVDSGEYATASEVIRDGLRMLRAAEETRQAKLEALRMEIQKGFQGTPVDHDEAWRQIREKTK